MTEKDEYFMLKAIRLAQNGIDSNAGGPFGAIIVYNGEIIGVLEYVNRIGEPPFESFTPDEMDNAAMFAEVIASLVNAYESAKLLRDFGSKMLSDKNEPDYIEIRNWLRTLRDSTEHREMMDLAVLLREIAARGDGERQLCRELLESILRFSDTKTETSFLNF